MQQSNAIPCGPKQAICLGSKYYKGKTCEKHPDSLRYTHNHACMGCEKDRGQTWRLANRGAYLARRKAWILANPEKHRAAKARWKNKNKARLNEARKGKAAVIRSLPVVVLLRQAVANNKAARKLAKAQQARAEHEDRARELQAMRYAASMIGGTEGEPLTLKHLRDRVKRGKHRARARGLFHDLKARELAQIGDSQGWACAHCGATGDLVLDHIRPLSLGGTHTANNVQWLCVFHNADKHNRLEFEYRRLRGIPLATPWDIV